MSYFPSPSLSDLSDQVEFETGSGLTGIGLIAPFDFVLDQEYWEWIPANVSLHVTRSPFLDQQVGVAMAEQVSEDEVLTTAAQALTIANPAVTVARSLSDTFAGIAPSGVIAFIAAQLAGMVLAVAVGNWLWPDGHGERA